VKMNSASIAILGAALAYDREVYKENRIDGFTYSQKLEVEDCDIFSTQEGDYEYFTIRETANPMNKLCVKIWLDRNTLENKYEFVQTEEDLADYKRRFFKGETCGTLDGNLNKWRNRK
jgi:hypothetical protein